MASTAGAVGRRRLRFDNVDELLAELDRIVGTPTRTSGDWSAAQIIEHLAKFVEFSFDGFPFRMPWHVRLACWLLKHVAWHWLLDRAMRPGYRLPESASGLLPGPDARLDASSARLRAALDRIRSGERMTQPSPFEGRITHEQWLEAHLRHAELHLSFVHPCDNTVAALGR